MLVFCTHYWSASRLGGNCETKGITGRRRAAASLITSYGLPTVQLLHSGNPITSTHNIRNVSFRSSYCWRIFKYVLPGIFPRRWSASILRLECGTSPPAAGVRAVSLAVTSRLVTPLTGVKQVSGLPARFGSAEQRQISGRVGKGLRHPPSYKITRWFRRKL
jgi:hypothetical protein